MTYGSIRECVRAVQAASVDCFVFDLRDSSQPEDVDALIDAFNQNTTLRTIRLVVPYGTSGSQSNSFFHGKIPLLLESIVSGPQLVTVAIKLRDLGGPNHRDDAVAIANAIRSNGSSLKVLDLSYNSFDDEDCEILTNALSQNTSVSDLNLEDNRVCDGGAIAFANNLFMKNKSSLKYLNLWSNQITSVGYQALALSIRHTSKLEHLNIYENTEISKNAALSFEQSMGVNFSIKRLDVDFPSARYKKIRMLTNLNRKLSSAYDAFSKIGGSRDNTIPPGLWPRIFSKFGKRPGLLYPILRKDPQIFLTKRRRRSRKVVRHKTYLTRSTDERQRRVLRRSANKA